MKTTQNKYTQWETQNDQQQVHGIPIKGFLCKSKWILSKIFMLFRYAIEIFANLNDIIINYMNVYFNYLWQIHTYICIEYI